MSIYCVYWLRLPIHSSRDDGYIGISNQPHKRFKQHKQRKTNPHLTNAFAKYDNITMDILFEGTKDECKELERQLRPRAEMGWNIVPGGGMPPSWKGRKRRPETVAARSAAMKGKRPNFHGHLPHNTPQWRETHNKRMRENNPNKPRPGPEFRPGVFHPD